MPNILLLGPGLSRHRINGEPFGTDKTDYLTVVDLNPECKKFWEDADVDFIDLRKGISPHLRLGLLPYQKNFFTEIHAYEVLNLLPGDDGNFFNFWEELWRIMEPSGKVFATVPHWESQWIHAYPAPQRTYTPGLLSYLDQDKHIAAKSDFSHLWPRPYCFKLISSLNVQYPEGQNQGYRFVLEKA